MFDRFLGRYPLPSGTPGEIWDDATLVGVRGYMELARASVGLPLCGGLMRILTAREGHAAKEFVSAGFPEFSSRATPFGVDWLGSILAIDRARPSGLVVIEPGSAEAFEIDESFVEFFDVDLVDDPDTYLAADLYREWQKRGGRAPGVGECVGFKVPLFLGGSGSPDNLELVDLEVYWSLVGQLRIQTRAMPPGAKIGRVNSVS